MKPSVPTNKGLNQHAVAEKVQRLLQFVWITYNLLVFCYDYMCCVGHIKALEWV